MREVIEWVSRRPVVWGTLWTGTLVGSLYLWPLSRDPSLRHSVPVIQRRMLSMLAVTTLQALVNPVPLRAQGLTVPLPHLLPSTAAPLLAIALLFAGPLLQRYLQPDLFAEDEDDDEDEKKKGGLMRMTPQRWRQLRDIVVAPLCEEYLFRAALIPLCERAGWGRGTVIGVSPLIFSVAHVHHLRSVAPLLVLLQCGYTALFGAISAYLFTASGHNYYAAAGAHMFCNWMGLPPLMSLIYPPPHQSPLTLWAVRLTYLGGLVAFFTVSPLLIQHFKAPY